MSQDSDTNGESLHSSESDSRTTNESNDSEWKEMMVRRRKKEDAVLLRLANEKAKKQKALVKKDGAHHDIRDILRRNVKSTADPTPPPPLRRNVKSFSNDPEQPDTKQYKKPDTPRPVVVDDDDDFESTPPPFPLRRSTRLKLECSCSPEEKEEDVIVIDDSSSSTEVTLPLPDANEADWTFIERESGTKLIRNWFGTCNNWTSKHLRDLKNYIKDKSGSGVIGKEVGEDGTPHLQFCFFLPHQTTLSGLKTKLGNQFHFEKVKMVQAAIDYCKKDGLFEIIGNLPLPKESRDKSSSDKWHEIRNNAEANQLDLIPDRLMVMSRHLIEKTRDAALAAKIPDLIAPEVGVKPNKWYFGPTGTGKSYLARARYPGSVSLDGNVKWWDGHGYAETILLEEIDKESAKSMLSLYKRWGDCYKFEVQIKGGMNWVRPKVIVVTSNWSIRELWPDPKDYEPIERRFEQWLFDVKCVPGIPPLPDAGRLYNSDQEAVMGLMQMADGPSAPRDEFIEDAMRTY